MKASPERVVVVLGGAADDVREVVDLSGVEVVENDEFGEGCSTSVRAGLGALPEDTAGIVLMLGDQPRVRPEAVDRLMQEAGGHAVGVCEYDDGLGHPLWFDRSMFPALEAMHGDKAVWKLVERHPERVLRIELDRPLPRDVDTWEDYEAALSAVAGTGA